MDRHGRPPISVFSVEDYFAQQAAPRPPLVRMKSGRGIRWMQLTLLVFSLLAFCGAASEIYFLMKVESTLRATQDMIHESVAAQKMISRPAFQDGPPLPSAHVTGLPVVDSSPNVSLQWDYRRGLAFLHEVEYKDGSLVCLKTGLYFIYSKLQLGLTKCPQNSGNSIFTHRVFQRHSTWNVAIMDNIKNFCDTHKSSVWRGSSFISGSFMLEKGDEVHVSMSHKHLIRVQGDTDTFFGMFMVYKAQNE